MDSVSWIDFVQQGDFLLIILKNLIEKQQNTWGKSKLKIILMYVINLFSGETLFCWSLYTNTSSA